MSKLTDDGGAPEDTADADDLVPLIAASIRGKTLSADSSSCRCAQAHWKYVVVILRRGWGLREKIRDVP